MKHFIYILVFLIGSLGFGQNEQLFQQANDLYNKGDFEDAISKYESIIESGVHSAALYFNLANAHYKLNHIAPSIYYYEKALKLSPNDKEIHNNIAFARNMTIDAIDKTPVFGFEKFAKKITNWLTFDTWAKLSILLMALFVVFYLIYYFNYGSTKKRVAFITAITFFILACCSVALAFNNYHSTKNDQPAIVFAKESQVKSEPNLRSSESFKLHEGTKVQILDTVNHWKKIQIADGKTGWIPADDIKAL
ncbi:tetratricopeptide repeat protein [Gelidibacter japonicus]|uniref:tetratricopeptide repeat protein n=1 Tax=Gelidibacter japonicus TaxID=1962232 RepID=UPI0020211303|nr:tetratricopeptide repeat protein [Gelidibacter japonicus]MCL8008576.1 tetratricopeptide repeat protein [Gelidibacter japonicus]